MGLMSARLRRAIPQPSLPLKHRARIHEEGAAPERADAHDAKVRARRADFYASAVAAWKKKKAENPAAVMTAVERAATVRAVSWPEAGKPLLR